MTSDKPNIWEGACAQISKQLDAERNALWEYYMLKPEDLPKELTIDANGVPYINNCRIPDTKHGRSQLSFLLDQARLNAERRICNEQYRNGSTV
jgi:hypothetical protein